MSAISAACSKPPRGCRAHGKTRVFDTPISECGIIGVAVGMAPTACGPVPEIQFADYIYPALDQLVSEAARLRYRSAGEYTAPLTVRTPFGGGIFGGQTHSQSPEGIFTHVAGLKTVIPSNPYDAKGLLIAAIEDNDPVIFFEPKRIYNGPFDGHYDRPVTPWAKHPARARCPRAIIAFRWARRRWCARARRRRCCATARWSMSRTGRGARDRRDAEIIDLRTLVPLDIETIEASVRKTGRCIVAARGDAHLGFGAELAALVQERCFYSLEAPVERVTGWDTPYPHSLEWAYFPGPVRLTEALKRVLEG
jgi:2-oxoisovalerate dehydrogenase E1 component beta subunit